jgi:cation efflux system protein involved in nickel and cobalt tolerance
VSDLAEAAVRNAQGQPVLLSTLAEVKRGAALKRGDASFNGKPAVVLMVIKQPDVDTPTVTRAVERRLADLNRTLPADVQVQQTFRQGNFIDSAIRNVSESLLLGVVIVSVVIVLFLMNWRAAVISLSAIPLSLLIGLMLMKALGLGINTMTLGGLVVAIGSVVDDSIVDMENCYRGLRRNQASRTPQSPLQVVFDTSVQVRQPVLFSTVIIAVVFAPIFSLTGVEGRIFAPMGLAYLLSIGASTLVAVTLSPALCAILLAPVQLPEENTWLATQAERLYRPILDLALRSPRRVLAIALALMVATSLILPALGRVFLPEFREQSLVNSMVLYPRGIAGHDQPGWPGPHPFAPEQPAVRLGAGAHGPRSRRCRRGRREPGPCGCGTERAGHGQSARCHCRAASGVSAAAWRSPQHRRLHLPPHG